MSSPVSFSKSSRYQDRYPEVAFGLTLISGCSNFENPAGFDQYKRKLLRKMRRRETLAQITERINAYEKFFAGFGFDCPLPNTSREPSTAVFPDTTLWWMPILWQRCVLESWWRSPILTVLMGHWCWIRQKRESSAVGWAARSFGPRRARLFSGMKRISSVSCARGADEKTRVGEDTRNVLFYAYGIPGVEGNHLRDGLTIAAETMRDFGEGIIQGVEVY